MIRNPEPEGDAVFVGDNQSDGTRHEAFREAFRRFGERTAAERFRVRGGRNEGRERFVFRPVLHCINPVSRRLIRPVADESVDRFGRDEQNRTRLLQSFQRLFQHDQSSK